MSIFDFIKSAIHMRSATRNAANRAPRSLHRDFLKGANFAFLEAYNYFESTLYTALEDSPFRDQINLLFPTPLPVAAWQTLVEDYVLYTLSHDHTAFSNLMRMHDEYATPLSVDSISYVQVAFNGASPGNAYEAVAILNKGDVIGPAEEKHTHTLFLDFSASGPCAYGFLERLYWLEKIRSKAAQIGLDVDKSLTYIPGKSPERGVTDQNPIALALGVTSQDGTPIRTLLNRARNPSL